MTMKHPLTSIFITLGSDVEFGLTDASLFISKRLKDARGNANLKVIDLGPPTRENFKRLIANMTRLEIHMVDEDDYDFGEQKPNNPN